MSKILFIYLDALLPINNGSRKNSFSVVEYLNRENVIDIFSIYYEDKNDESLRKYCNNLFECQNPLKNIFAKSMNKLINQFIFNPLNKDLILKLFLKNKLIEILDNNNYDKIILNYIQWTNILPQEYLPKTIIFTHDIYYYRYQSFSTNKMHKYMYNFVKKYEIEQLKKFYKILVVAEYEKKELSQYIDHNKIVYIGAPQEIKKIDILKYQFTFGFLGADAWQNEEAIIYFIKNYLDDLDGELVIAGSICNNKNIKELTKKNKKINLVGFVESLDEFYMYCKFVVAPILSGSGIKIKVLEALSYGKVVIATNKALEGISVKNKIEVLNFDELNTSKLNSTLSNMTEKEYINISKNAIKFIESNFSKEKLFKSISGE